MPAKLTLTQAHNAGQAHTGPVISELLLAYHMKMSFLLQVVRGLQFPLHGYIDTLIQKAYRSQVFSGPTHQIQSIVSIPTIFEACLGAGMVSEMILGENKRPAFSNTNSACLDLFFSIVPGSDVQKLHTLLKLAWNECP